MTKQGTILSLVLFIVSCNQETPSSTVTISASACAKQTSDGTIVECEPSREAGERLTKMMASMKRIDDEYPGPRMPSTETLFSVARVNDEGNIILKNGQMLILAGLECHHPDLIKYLRAVFLESKPSKLVYLETSRLSDSIVYAYIWEVDTELVKDLGDGIAMVGPAVSSTNETALTSGWCRPEEQEGHHFNARYQNLANLAH